jgi:hypothetical protein
MTPFLVLWARHRWENLTDIGQALEVIYGSEHSSAPALRRYDVTAGDRVYVVGVDRGELLLIARLCVDEVKDVIDYYRDAIRLRGRDLALDEMELARRLARVSPNLGHRAPISCAVDAATGVGTPLRTDLRVPRRVLERLRLTTKAGAERPIELEDGLIKRAVKLQGHFFRLTPASAKALDRLLV